MPPAPLTTDQRLARSDAGFGLGVAAVALVNYLPTLCPTVGPGDSGELTLAALRLGVCHPPGYPMFTWLGRIATLLGGEPALAANALTALVASAAAGALYLACRAQRLSRTGSIAGALTLAFSATFWQQSLCCEVYSLSILLLSLLLLVSGLAAAGNPRTLPLLGFLFGLALAHQPTTLLWLPALSVLTLSAPGRAGLRPGLVPALLMLLVGASASLGTFFLARANPAINWGDPSTPGRFLTHFAGRQYGDLALTAVFRLRLPGLPRLLASNFGIPSLILMLAGLVQLALGNRRLLLGVLLLLATALFALAYQVFDYQVHLLPAFVGLALLAAGAADLVERLAGRAGRLLAVLLLAAPGFALFANYPAAAELRSTVVRDLGADLLASLPDGAVLVSGDDASRNAVRYLQEVHGMRTDVIAVSSEMLFSEVYHAQMKRQLPLRDYLASLRRAGTGTREQRKQVLLAELVAAVRPQRPVYLTTDVVDQEFFNGPVARLWRPVPEGIVVRLAGRTEPLSRDSVLAVNDRLWSRYRSAARYRALPNADLANVQLVYASARNNFGAFCREQGWKAESQRSLTEALRFPIPDWLRRLVERQLELVR